MGIRTASLWLGTLCCALLLCSASVLANPYEVLKPIPVPTSAEVRAAIAGEGGVPPGHFSLYIAHLWDGRRDLLLEALHSDDLLLQTAAMRALAKIGDSGAVSVLSSVVADTSASFTARRTAAQVLGAVADSSALGCLRAFLPAARAEGSVYAEAVELAMKRIVRPDMRRPLIVRGSNFLEFRFLLDDIQAIYFLDGGLTAAQEGTIFTTHSHGASGRYDFPAESFAHMCTLLQDARFVSPEGMLAMRQKLVIELHDGRHIAMNRDGDTFWVNGDWQLYEGLFVVKAEPLAQYIDEMRN